jgi:hypothetical protein
MALVATCAFTSCQKPKDWTCTCECKPIGGSSFTATGTIKNSTQSEANSKCTDYGQAQVNGNGTWKCTVK